jgi:ABC-type nickel/cobalt efflux system permease component RcnA
MTSVLLILAAAAGVGIAHSVLPDHWVPLAVIARANRWSLARTARTSLLASLGHVGASLLLGLVFAAAGLALRQDIVAMEGQIVGGILVLTGLGFLAWALLTRGRQHAHAHPHAHSLSHDDDDHHHDHDHDHDHEADHDLQHAAAAEGHGPADRDPGGGGEGSWVAQVAVPFGVAASPDLTVLPVFFAASAIGVSAAVGALVVFAVATVGTFVVLTLAATIGGYQVQWPWLDRNGHVVSALVLLVVGILVYLRF